VGVIDFPGGFSLTYIAAPDLPDPEKLKRLQANLRAEPRVKSAWIFGQRIIHPDEPAPVEQSVIALYVESSLAHEDVHLLLADLRIETGWVNWATVPWLPGIPLKQPWEDVADKIYESTSATG
jgi:hypothetical protein